MHSSVDTNTAHVFVCHGALSFDAAERIARTLPSGARRYFLLLFQAPELEVDHTTRVVRLPNVSRSEWVKPFAMTRALCELLGMFDTDRVTSIVAYFPHPFDPPGNWFAFSEPRVQRVELLPDGLVNYLSGSHRPPPGLRRLRYEVRVLLRRLAATRYGIRYQALEAAHLTQFEVVDYACAWTDQPLGYKTSRTGNVTLLPPRVGGIERPVATSETRVLIVDQELDSLVRPEVEQRLRTRLLAVTEDLAPPKVYYKAHPRGRNRSVAFGAAVEDVSGPVLAEQLAVTLGITHVLGFYSSALLSEQPGVVRRIAFLPSADATGVIKPEYLAEVLDVLAKAGVTLDERSLAAL